MLAGATAWVVSIAAQSPPNDNYLDATWIPAIPSGVAGTTVGATVEPDEIDRLISYNTVWYKWIPSETAGWRLRFPKAFAGVGARVFTGADSQSLRQVAGVNGGIPGSLTAQAGETYYLRVSSSPAGSFELIFEPGPAHDLFANRLILVAREESYEADFTGSGIEPGEPGGGAGGHSLWFKWRAPTTGGYYVDVPNANWQTLVSVFRGEALSELRPLIANTLKGSGSVQTVIRVEEGVEYAIRLRVAEDNGRRTQFWLRHSPPNDDWANAAALGAINTQIEGTTIGSTLETGEYELNPGHRGSVWYFWDVPTTGKYIARSTTTGGLTRLTVHRGASLSALMPIFRASLKDQPSGEYLAPFEAVAGERIFISAAPNFSNSSGFMVGIMAPVSNDHFRNAEEISGANIFLPARPFLGSTEEGEPRQAGVEISSSLWWKWIAPHTGTFIVETAHESRRVSLDVYSGESLASLIPHGSNAKQGKAVHVGFRAIAGEKYFIRAGQELAESFPIELTLQPGLPNDEFDQAEELTGLSATTTFLFRAASQEPNDEFPSAEEKGTLWWRWTAPTAGPYLLAAFANVKEGNELELGVFKGESRGDLIGLVSSVPRRDETKVSFEAAQGDRFYFCLAAHPSELAIQPQFTLILQRGPQNDRFESAQEVFGNVISIASTTLGATREEGEPLHRGSELGASVWFKWVAPFTGRVRYKLSSQVVTLIRYRGTSVHDLERMFDPAYETFDVVAGTQYFLAFDSPVPWMEDFRFTLGQPPKNDNYADRESITQLDTAYRSSTVFAGREGFEPSYVNNSLWWTWTAPGDGVAAAEASGGTPTVRIFYHHAGLGPTRFVDEGPWAVSYANKVAVVAGTTYDIRVTTQVPYSAVALTMRFIPASAQEHWRDPSFMRGGSSLWRETSDASFVRSLPTAFQGGIGGGLNGSWIQRIYHGPGRLMFWWRTARVGPSNLRFEKVLLPGQNGNYYVSAPGPNWSKVDIQLSLATNVVRWSQESGLAGYVDDIEFIPAAPTLLSPQFQEDGTISLTFKLGTADLQKKFIIERSFDLRNWESWTNVHLLRANRDATFNHRFENDAQAERAFYRVQLPPTAQ